MSTRREDDSRPKGDATSQRSTARDVPTAKYREEVPVGTVPPRGLRGASLLEGQGAPERLAPEDVELAILRDAETMDGPSVARATAKRQPEPSLSPSPIPVSVEVPRARSLPPSDELSSTPPSPSGRSIQSGTLMSVGSIDPRAPTERSLPSPRPLLVSERAAYFGPESVVDRSPQRAGFAPEPRAQPAMDSARLPAAGVRGSSPSSKPGPNSSQRGMPESSARPALGPESVAPPAQNFARAARSYAPVSYPEQAGPPGSDAARLARPAAPSARDVATQFHVHSELDALPQELLADSFDLRSAHTQREPLASRKPQPSSAGVSAHAPTPEVTHAPNSRANRSSASALTVFVDRDRDPSTPSPPPAALPRAVVPLSWLLAVAVGVLITLLALWILRTPTARDGARVPQDQATTAAPDSAPLPAPARPPESALVGQATPPVSSASPPPILPHASVARPAAPPSARADDPFAAPLALPSAPTATPDAGSKGQQSIY